MKKLILLFIVCTAFSFNTNAQDMMELVKKAKAKIDAVNDYVAEGKMKTDVTFIKAPVGNIKVYYKKPNRFRLKRDGGISILPKGGVTVNMSNIVATTNFIAIAAGEEMVGGVKTKKIKLLPVDDATSDVVISTVYIDEANLLVCKAITTTKENGTYEMEMNYGKYSSYGLPDKLTFSFNTKDYKIPKGITMEFDEEEKKNIDKIKNKKGKVEITYTSYTINKGVDDSVFK
jgi:outer membrane lipoprotein-sorting protein